MKDHNCDGCRKPIKVYDDYQQEFCCSARIEDECGCMGRPINPVFCDDCEVKIFGEVVK